MALLRDAAVSLLHHVGVWQWRHACVPTLSIPNVPSRWPSVPSSLTHKPCNAQSSLLTVFRARYIISSISERTKLEASELHGGQTKGKPSPGSRFFCLNSDGGLKNMTRKVTLVAIQPPNVRYGTDDRARKTSNIDIMFDMMSEASTHDPDLICLPETFQTNGLNLDAATALAFSDEEGSELSSKLCDFAHANRVNIIAPVLGNYDGEIRNVAWVISRDGDHIGRYFKVHLTDPEHVDCNVQPGDTWPVFELDFGKVGVMICHDNSFPESARCLMLSGAEVICWPHVQSGWGDIEWDITLRSRAIDNAVYVLSSCYGVQPSKAWRPGMMVGRSSLVGPDGTILADQGRQPGVMAASVDLDHVHLKHEFGFHGDNGSNEIIRSVRRPGVYGRLVEEMSTVVP